MAPCAVDLVPAASAPARAGRLLVALAVAVWTSGAAALPAHEVGEGEGSAPLSLDVDRHVAEALARHRRTGVPRFEVEVAERWPQLHLERHFSGVDLACRPSKAGPPSIMELRRHSGASIPVHADFLGPLKALARLFRGKGPARYFLYLVQEGEQGRLRLEGGPGLGDCAAGNAGSGLGAGRGVCGPERGVSALRRLEHGMGKPEPASDDERLPPWVETTCRPPGFD